MANNIPSINNMNSNSKIFRSLDLFAGIGGIRLGFEKAGFATILGNDFDPYCKVTYDINFDKTPLLVADIATIDSNDIPKFDILLGGFPCQPFSIAGYRRGFLDTGRGDIFFEIVRILRDKKPKALFLENVKNLKSHDKGKTFKIISDALADLGYHIKSEVLNSMHYGNVPQNRERIYIVGFKSKKTLDAFHFPEPLNLTKNFKDFIDDSVPDKYYYNNNPIYPKLVNDITSFDSIYQWRRAYVRENKSGVCPTLTANMGTGGHNVPLVKDKIGIRKLTPRECARLQGFSDDFILPTELPDSKLYKQIGNSVTVSVIERVASNIKQAMEA